MEKIATWVAVTLIGVPIQILGYFLLLGIFLFPAFIVAFLLKIKSGGRLADHFENSFGILMGIYLLAVPLLFYYIWGWKYYFSGLTSGSIAVAFLVVILFPLHAITVFAPFVYLITRKYFKS